MIVVRRTILLFFLFLAATVVAAFVARVARPPQPQMVEISVYFTDENRFAAGTPPFEIPVSRRVPAAANLPAAVLAEFFEGPTPTERAQGLIVVTSGFTGLDRLEVTDGIARVYLQGPCQSGGAAYTVAQPIFRNLLQFPAIRYVKIYDSEGTTQEPEGPVNSIPACLEP